MKKTKIMNPYDKVINGATNIYLNWKNIEANAKPTQLDLHWYDVGDPDHVYYTYYPNPANEYVELSVEPGSEVKDKTAKIRIEKAKGQDGLGEYAVEIWSDKGGRLKTFTSKENRLHLSTRNLPQGEYFIHLIANGKTYKQQLLIEK